MTAMRRGAGAPSMQPPGATSPGSGRGSSAGELQLAEQAFEAGMLDYAEFGIRIAELG
jgi:hypothetical protein